MGEAALQVTALSRDSWRSRWQEAAGHFDPANFVRDHERQMKHPVRELITAEVLRVGGTVLDVACASAIDYLSFKDSRVEYTGVDVTRKYVEYARQLFPEADVRVADVLDLPFPSGSFDTVYCKDLLGHLPLDEWRNAVGEMWRVCKSQMLLAEMVFRDAASEQVLQGNGFYQNWISWADLNECLACLSCVGSVEVAARNLGYNGTHLVKVIKFEHGKRRRKNKMPKPKKVVDTSVTPQHDTIELPSPELPKSTAVNEPSRTDFPGLFDVWCHKCDKLKHVVSIMVDQKGAWMFRLECGHSECYEFKVASSGVYAEKFFGKT